MRIAILAETYLPLVSAVTHSLQRVFEHLVCRGSLASASHPRRLRTGCRSPRVSVRARAPSHAGRRSTGHTNRGGVSNGCARGPRKVRSSVSRSVGLAAGHRNPPVCNPHSRTISFRRAAAGTPRHPESRTVGPRSRHDARSPGQAKCSIPREGGAERRTTDRFVGRLAVEKRVEDLVALAGVDLFVHPGESETFCQTIQEAMASGVPVVATARGGPVDLVDSSRTGWFFTPGDLGQLR